MKRLVILSLVLFVFGCSSEVESDEADAFSEADATGENDVSTVDTDLDTNTDTSPNTNTDTSPDTDTGAEPEPDPGAREYCESTAEIFCAYYIRCGRMHAGSVEECLEIFEETCPAVYQPHYVALEDAGVLELSKEGIATCAAHLESVECSTQVFDLDGPCSSVWQGLSAPGDPCGPGIESFVCQEESVCVLDLSFCGTCQTARSVGQPCGGGMGSCEQTASCVDSLCVERALPGASCGEEQPCVLGASCVEGICARFDVVEVGGDCDQGRRCPYNAVCLDGVCAAQSGPGGPCESHQQCRSGFCDGEQCAALLDEGDACTSSWQCISNRCDEGVCAGLPTACF